VNPRNQFRGRDIVTQLSFIVMHAPNQQYAQSELMTLISVYMESKLEDCLDYVEKYLLLCALLLFPSNFSSKHITK
jgi:hypothetical protein